MKNKDESKSKAEETTTQSRLEAVETELSPEQDINLEIALKSYEEPTRPFFSSPCMLSELDDTE